MDFDNVLIVDKSVHFPFCAFTFRQDDPYALTWIDFWAVELCSNASITRADGNTQKRQFGMFARPNSRLLLSAS
jgi:hypothetical protein